MGSKAAILLLVVGAAGSASADLSCIQSCLKVLGSGYKDCVRCVNEHAELGQVPPTYAKDMLAFVLTDADYVDGWCGKHKLHPEQGVDTKVHPTGWVAVQDAEGNVSYTGCEVTKDFPGIDTTSHQSYKYVKEHLETAPRRQEAGEIWRGNELGFIVNHDLFWKKVSPKAIGLGATPKQHKVIRPILDEIYGTCDSKCAAELAKSAAMFINGRDKLNIRGDLSQWVFEVLFKKTFPTELNPIDPAEFVEMQGSVLSLQPITQILPTLLGELVANQVVATKDRYQEIILGLVRKHYGARLETMDCSPTPGGCANQLASGILDALIAAGGASIPSALSTALWVMYGDVTPYGDTFPKDFVLDKEEATAFFYETLRMFPPVVGFPYWTTFPDRAYDDDASQFKNGKREVLNVALANRDPNQWGADAHKFRIRSLDEYHKMFIGFAEPAVDPNVANGAMNRNCPAKALALQMGKAFLQNIEQGEWEIEGDRKDIKYKLVTPFVDAFVLKKVGSGEPGFWEKLWGRFN